MVLGASDGGAHVRGVINVEYSTASFDELVRTEPVFTVEELVHEFTDVPARLYGLVDRGRIQEGFHADLTVFDPDRIASSAGAPGPGSPRWRHPPSQPRRRHRVGDRVPAKRSSMTGQFTGRRSGHVLRAGTDSRPAAPATVRSRTDPRSSSTGGTMGRVEGKTAFITGAARGQGRSHALRLAEEGADIIAIDICAQMESVPFPMARPEDLEETVALVEALDRRIVAASADVRDLGAARPGPRQRGWPHSGGSTSSVRNAGIASHGTLGTMSERTWQDVIDVNLTGVWHACKAAIPHIVAGGRGGSLILTSSTVGIRAIANLGHYGAAKHGVVGLMRTLALELAPEMIRVNSIHPTSVDTDMIHNADMYSLLMPGVERPTRALSAPVFESLNALPIPWVEPRDISNAVLFLASDEARYITGVALPVDAGSIIK